VQQLGFSESTVKFHISEVFNKFGVSNCVQALRVLEMQT
jgi:DNA-binding CsgD family transcriptional regulator